MKYSRFLILLICLVILFPVSLYAADAPQRRGVQVKPAFAPTPESLYGQSHAVIIGISSYDKMARMEHGVRDARAIEEKLKARGFLTRVLLDSQASGEGIIKLLGEELPHRAQGGDRVVVFFSGHSHTRVMPDGSRLGYLVPADADPADLSRTSISMDQVRDLSGKMQARSVVFLIDSCLSGLGLTAFRPRSASSPDYLAQIASGQARQVLTACGQGEVPHQAEGGLSAFTLSVLKALDGQGDRDGKGFVTFSDMAAFVKEQLSSISAAKQVPQFGSISGEGEVLISVAGTAAVQQAGKSGPEPAVQVPAGAKEIPEAEGLSLAAKQEQMQKKLRDERQRKARPEPGKALSGLSQIARDERFIAYDNGTVLDTKTNLMWAAKDNGADINWSSAKRYCEDFRRGGYTDWRMPTQDELAGLYDESVTNGNQPSSGCDGAYHITSLIHLTCCCAWAAESRGSKSAYFGFSSGPRNWLDQFQAGSVRVLPVRSAK